MSEERRKKQQERERRPCDRCQDKKDVHLRRRAGPARWRIYRWPLLPQSQIRFVRANAWPRKQAKMYGLYWCPHCIEQKEMFGDAFHNVPYVECAIKGSSELAPACKIAGVKLFPSWQFGAEPPKEGVLSLEALSDKTGCSLP